MTLILSGTDGVSDVDGTAATPAVRGSDTNTGIFFPAADTIAFAEGGAEVARFDASGNLGIGNTAPGYRLDVTAGDTTAGFGYAVRLRSNATAGAATIQFTNNAVSTENGFIRVTDAGLMSFTNRAYIDSSGRLLIAGTNASYSSGFLQLNAGKAIIASSDSGFGQVQIGGVAEASIGFFSGVTAFGDNPTSSSGNTHVWAIGANVFGVGGSSWGIGNKGANNWVARINWNSTSWIFSSDERLKDVEGRVENALDKVAGLRPVYFTWKNDQAKQRKVGLLAQDVLQVLPEAVTVPEQETREDGSQNYLGLGMSDLVPLLTAAIQELKAIVDAQGAEIAALKGQE